MSKQWKQNDTYVYIEGNSQDFGVCDTQSPNMECLSYETAVKNAALIVRAVNSHEAAQRLAKALTALVEECKTNLDFAVNPYNTEADALSAAGAALAEWEAVK